MPIDFSSRSRGVSPPAPPVSIQSQRLKQCVRVFSRWMHFPNDFEAVITILGAVAGNYMPECPPVWLMIVGPSGGGKTQLVRTLRWNSDIVYSSDMTEAGLLSWGQDSTGAFIATGILPDDVKDFGIIAVPEFSSVLGMNANKQKPLLSALRQVYDGEYSRKIRSEAGRLSWSGKCGFIAASAPGIDSQRSVMAEMGERFVYYRIAYTKEDRRMINDLIGRRGSKVKDMKKELEEAVRDVLQPVIRNPPDFNLSDGERTRLNLMAEFSSQCRSVIERSSNWNRDVEETHDREIGGRLMDEFAGLLRGLLAIGTDYPRAWRILETVTWNSIPYTRARVLRVLFENTTPGDKTYFGGLRRIMDLVQGLSPDGVGAAHRSISRALEELVTHGALEQQKGGRKGLLDAWRVKPDTWERYAAISDDPPDDPRRGLFGSATSEKASEGGSEG